MHNKSNKQTVTENYTFICAYSVSAMLNVVLVFVLSFKCIQQVYKLHVYLTYTHSIAYMAL